MIRSGQGSSFEKDGIAAKEKGSPVARTAFAVKRRCLFGHCGLAKAVAEALDAAAQGVHRFLRAGVEGV